jgi:hypothetical protein
MSFRDAVAKLRRPLAQNALLVLRVAVVDRDYRLSAAEALQVEEVS